MTEQDKINADGEALDAIMKRFHDLFGAIKALGAGQSGLIDEAAIADARMKLIEVEIAFDGERQAVNDERTWLCVGDGCARLDRRLRAVLNVAQRAEHDGWCEECADAEYRAQREHERIEAQR